MAAPMSKEEFLSKLTDLGIDAPTVEHPEVFTVEQALPHIENLDGLFAKNLFLRDKKKSLWLYCAPHDADIKLNDLAKMVGAPGGFRFAGEDVLNETLGVKQGCVTVFGLINDVSHKVKLVLDSRFWDEAGEVEGGVKKRGGGEGGENLTDGPTQEKASTPEDGSGETVESSSESSAAGAQRKRDAGAKCEQRFYFHPLVNSASTGVTVSDLKRFLAHTVEYVK
ncbi:hypothetical protein BaRGS_00025069, partial [Batillaria attramentaria]